MKRRSRAFSLIEVVLAATILSMIAVAAAQLLTVGIASFNRTDSQSDATNDVSVALQYLTRDLQEAKEITLVSPYYIRIYYPLKSAGSYDRMTLDAVNYVEFYRSDYSYSPKASGPFFVRKRANEAGQRICFNVSGIAFKVPSPGSIDVSVSVTTSDGSTCNMLHRAIFMRNY
jgi:prepilin-type N-terminal cleavage/methylation domain-containing protein